jgi:hypothetical protein
VNALCVAAPGAPSGGVITAIGVLADKTEMETAARSLATPNVLYARTVSVCVP